MKELEKLQKNWNAPTRQQEEDEKRRQEEENSKAGDDGFEERQRKVDERIQDLGRRMTQNQAIELCRLMSERR